MLGLTLGRICHVLPRARDLAGLREAPVERHNVLEPAMGLQLFSDLETKHSVRANLASPWR